MLHNRQQTAPNNSPGKRHRAGLAHSTSSPPGRLLLSARNTGMPDYTLGNIAMHEVGSAWWRARPANQVYIDLALAARSVRANPESSPIYNLPFSLQPGCTQTCWTFDCCAAPHCALRVFANIDVLGHAGSEGRSKANTTRNQRTRVNLVTFGMPCCKPEKNQAGGGGGR